MGTPLLYHSLSQGGLQDLQTSSGTLITAPPQPSQPPSPSPAPHPPTPEIPAPVFFLPLPVFFPLHLSSVIILIFLSSP